MSRTWASIGIAVGVALVLFAGAVLYAVHRAPKPRGFSGLQFAALTPAASARTPLLARGGAQVAAVMDDSPADKAGIKPGEVLAAIDGTKIASARQASDMVRMHAAGDRISLTLYDVTKGEVHPQTVSLVFDAAPPVTKTFSVHPPRTLAKEVFNLPFPAANASWSGRILRGATIRPLALSGLGAGQCNAFAPEEWRVAGYAPDNSLFHVMAKAGFAHAIFKSAALNGVSPDAFLLDFLQTTFGASTLMTPPQAQPFGPLGGGGAGRRCQLGQAAGGGGGAVHALRRAGRARRFAAPAGVAGDAHFPALYPGAMRGKRFRRQLSYSAAAGLCPQHQGRHVPGASAPRLLAERRRRPRLLSPDRRRE
jgi:hypothetical protein